VLVTIVRRAMPRNATVMEMGAKTLLRRRELSLSKDGQFQ